MALIRGDGAGSDGPAARVCVDKSVKVGAYRPINIVQYVSSNLNMK
jgi:hypothetical protein